jgi:hypothetical protein
MEQVVQVTSGAKLRLEKRSASGEGPQSKNLRPRKSKYPVDVAAPSGSVSIDPNDDSEILPNGFRLYSFINTYGHKLAQQIGATFEVKHATYYFFY